MKSDEAKCEEAEGKNEQQHAAFIISVYFNHKLPSVCFSCELSACSPSTHGASSCCSSSDSASVVVVCEVTVVVLVEEPMSDLGLTEVALLPGVVLSRFDDAVVDC